MQIEFYVCVLLERESRALQIKKKTNVYEHYELFTSWPPKKKKTEAKKKKKKKEFKKKKKIKWWERG